MQQNSIAESKIMETARLAIQNLGYSITKMTDEKIIFTYKKCDVEYWPHTGWHRGINIKSGTGLSNLLSQIK